MPLDPRNTSGIRQPVARSLLVLGVLLLAWGIAVTLTGGFFLDLGGLRVSSRNPLRPLLLGLLLCAIAWRFHYHRMSSIPASRIAVARRPVSRVVMSGAAAGLLICGLVFGARAAAGSDGFGYVSQSALWRDGSPRIDQRALRSLPWPNAEHTFASLGYRVGAEGYLVPTYAPGTAMLMAVARIFSPRGPYLVGPICGALLVIFTFLLGRRVFSRGAATLASVLTACSPTVVLLMLATAADVPAAAFWTGAFAAAAGGGRIRAPVAAGVLTGVALVARPNLVPLAIFPWLLVIVRSQRTADAIAPTIWYAAASVPFALLVAWVNDHLYGSPLASGYGELGPGFSFGFAAENLANYPAWWLQTQGPLAFLWVLAAARPAPMRRERLILAAFAACVGLAYVFYLPFHDWSFLRFGLPAMGIAFLFTADLVDWVARGRLAWRLAGFAALALVMAAHAMQFSRGKAILESGAEEQRYAVAGLHVLAHTPPDAVILTVQHGGSIRYYSGRLTMRWDMLDPEWLDRAIAILRARGLPVHVMLEAFEEPAFRERFRGQRALAQLDRGASALGWNGALRFYPLTDDRETAPRVPVTMTPVPFDGPIADISPAFTHPAALSRMK